jgi:hypothetical protein
MKTQFNRCKRNIAILMASALLFAPTVMFAQPQQSANFRITKSVLDAGGAPSSSANFHLVSAFGQSSPLGLQASANFSLSGGFLSPMFAVSPLSPIQHLVIQEQSPNVRLAWPRVPDAEQYKVYRSVDPLFTPAPTNYLGTATDTMYTDVNVIGSAALRNYYIVTVAQASGRSASAIAKPSIGSRDGKPDATARTDHYNRLK